MEVHINAVLGLQLIDGSICLQVGRVGLLGEGLQGIKCHCGLADGLIVIRGEGSDVWVNDRFDGRVFSYGSGNRDVLPGTADHFITATCLGAQAQKDLAQGVVVAVGVVDDDWYAVRVDHIGR